MTDCLLAISPMSVSLSVDQCLSAHNTLEVMLYRCAQRGESSSIEYLSLVPLIASPSELYLENLLSPGWVAWLQDSRTGLGTIDSTLPSSLDSSHS